MNLSFPYPALSRFSLGVTGEGIRQRLAGITSGRIPDPRVHVGMYLDSKGLPMYPGWGQVSTIQLHGSLRLGFFGV